MGFVRAQQGTGRTQPQRGAFKRRKPRRGSARLAKRTLAVSTAEMAIAATFARWVRQGDALSPPNGTSEAPQGPLYKQSRWTKAWATRHFELDLDRGMLQFRAHVDGEVLGHVPIEDITAVGVLPAPEDRPQWTVFYVHAAKAKWQLAAESRDEAQQWIDALVSQMRKRADQQETGNPIKKSLEPCFVKENEIDLSTDGEASDGAENAEEPLTPEVKMQKTIALTPVSEAERANANPISAATKTTQTPSDVSVSPSDDTASSNLSQGSLQQLLQEMLRIKLPQDILEMHESVLETSSPGSWKLEAGEHARMMKVFDMFKSVLQAKEQHLETTTKELSSVNHSLLETQTELLSVQEILNSNMHEIAVLRDEAEKLSQELVAEKELNRRLNLKVEETTDLADHYRRQLLQTREQLAKTTDEHLQAEERMLDAERRANEEHQECERLKDEMERVSQSLTMPFWSAKLY